VKGGAIIEKTQCVLGNLIVNGLIMGNICGHIYTDRIVAKELQDPIDFIGDLLIDPDFSLIGNIRTNCISDFSGDNTEPISIKSDLDLLCNDVRNVGNIEVSTISAKKSEDCIFLEGNLCPTIDGGYTLGTPENKWDTIYADHLQLQTIPNGLIASSSFLSFYTGDGPVTSPTYIGLGNQSNDFTSVSILLPFAANLTCIAFTTKTEGAQGASASVYVRESNGNIAAPVVMTDLTVVLAGNSNCGVTTGNWYVPACTEIGVRVLPDGSTLNPAVTVCIAEYMTGNV
jgi:hypothetical protein